MSTKGRMQISLGGVWKLEASMEVATYGQSQNIPRGKIYTFESDAKGFNTRTYFYDTGDEVVAFDTQFTPTLAEKSIEFLRSETNSPISQVVITHPSPDKFNGMSAFQKLRARVIASKRTAESLMDVHEYKRSYFVNVAKLFAEDGYPKLSLPDVIFEQTHDLRLKNGDVISLRELARPGVSSNQTVAMIPEQNGIVVGDLVHHMVHAWLEGGIVKGRPTPSLEGWVADLNEIRTLLKDAPDTHVYGGRGDSVHVNTAVKTQIAYLEKADRLVTLYVAGLGDRKSELLGDKAAEHYKAVQAEFEEAFPAHGLGYLIRDGVYGLLSSKL